MIYSKRGGVCVHCFSTQVQNNFYTSTSIYNLVLIYVCHIHHHFLCDSYSNLTTIEILVLLSWIPASKEFCAKVWVCFICNVLIVDVTFILSTSLEISDISPILPQMRSKRFRTPILLT